MSVSRDDWTRTSGLFVPNEARYRAALHPENECGYKAKNIFTKAEGSAIEMSGAVYTQLSTNKGEMKFFALQP